jgi:hypothetical protein
LGSQGRKVDFPVGRQRDAVKQHNTCRHHVLGQNPFKAGPQLALHEPFVGDSKYHEFAVLALCLHVTAWRTPFTFSACR